MNSLLLHYYAIKLREFQQEFQPMTFESNFITESENGVKHKNTFSIKLIKLKFWMTQEIYF